MGWWVVRGALWVGSWGYVYRAWRGVGGELRGMRDVSGVMGAELGLRVRSY